MQEAEDLYCNDVIIAMYVLALIWCNVLSGSAVKQEIAIYDRTSFVYKR